MHATKSHPAYYREILNRLERRSDECLMVGDSWKMDVLPASSVGLQVYWVNDEDEPPPQDVPLAGRGSLGELWTTVSASGTFPGAFG
jgi:FMN phosphatase YigB (HAD superfamily)